jgi:hypothetical protein
LFIKREIFDKRDKKRGWRDTKKNVNRADHERRGWMLRKMRVSLQEEVSLVDDSLSVSR